MKSLLSKQQRSKMFEAVKFGGATSRNRLVMAPMVTNFAGPDNAITDRQVDYYAERARGGVGTIIVEASVIQKTVRAFERQVGVYDDRFIPGLSQLARAIQAEGAAAVIQLHHAGPKINSKIGLQPVSVSPVAIRDGKVPRQLSFAELRQVPRDFAAAALRAGKAGFDGVELHAAHMYLLSASMSPYTNKRTDAYGGDIHGRTRLTREVIEEIKSALGPEYPVWVRMHGCEALKPGLDLEACQQAATIYAEAGADVIHVSAYTLSTKKIAIAGLVTAVGGGPTKETPPGPFLDYAGAIKEAVDIPVVAVGKLDDPSLAGSAISEGKCDMVALGRQLLCDPYWPVKTQEGREEEIVHCKYCETCHKALYDSTDIFCSQNLNLYGKPRYKTA